ncbi:MAG: ribosomal subunit interface protein [Candidatus Cloacimonas sp. 4484_209]|nr:MAG: ribosomal subunit interface protein [Candidatus Cloacimonas sp. 4484_209]
MKISITSRHFKLTDKVKTKIEKEFEKLKKYSDRIMDTEAIIEENSNRKSLELKVRIDKSLITAKFEDYELAKVIEDGFKKLESRVKKHIDKFHRRRKR